MSADIAFRARLVRAEACDMIRPLARIAVGNLLAIHTRILLFFFYLCPWPKNKCKCIVSLAVMVRTEIFCFLFSTFIFFFFPLCRWWLTVDGFVRDIIIRNLACPRSIGWIYFSSFCADFDKFASISVNAIGDFQGACFSAWNFRCRLFGISRWTSSHLHLTEFISHGYWFQIRRFVYFIGDDRDRLFMRYSSHSLGLRTSSECFAVRVYVWMPITLALLRLKRSLLHVPVNAALPHCMKYCNYFVLVDWFAVTRLWNGRLKIFSCFLLFA